MSLDVPLLLLIVAQLVTPAPRSAKVLTPKQRAYQAESKTYNDTVYRLRAAAKAAYAAETRREKITPCPSANSTVAINLCLSHESETTEANYKAFAGALRALLALPNPNVADDDFVGPTGRSATPATNAAAFDKAEAAWHHYADAQCTAVDTRWRGGTIVNAMYGECLLRVTRSRLHELHDAYDQDLRRY